MNVMLASGGYPWTVVPLEERDVYMAALEEVSVAQNIVPFTELLARLVDAGLKESVQERKQGHLKIKNSYDYQKIKTGSESPAGRLYPVFKGAYFPPPRE